MQKIVCCDLNKFEDRVNELLTDGWKVVPDTIRLAPGAAMSEKTTAMGTKDSQKEKRAIGYGMIALTKE